MAHRVRDRFSIFASVVASLLGASVVCPQQVSAGNTYHNVPGSACAPVDNFFADKLHRSHVRVYNPPLSGRDIWVICPIQRVQEDIASTLDAPFGYINVFFGDGSASFAEVPCTIREFTYDTVHIPGQGPSGIERFVNTTGKREGNVVPYVDDAFFAFSADSTSDYHYYTATCLLKQGTGINSIDFRQR